MTSQNLAYQQLDTDGSGVRIGVIDSGVDYHHPALGGCFGANCKVRYGYDLVGDDYNGDIATLKPDPDPMDNCGTGSGTMLIFIVVFFIFIFIFTLLDS